MLLLNLVAAALVATIASAQSDRSEVVVGEIKGKLDALIAMYTEDRKRLDAVEKKKVNLCRISELPVP